MPKQDKRKERVDTSTDQSPLTANPFAALGKTIGSPLPTAPELVAGAPVEEKLVGQPSFRVQRTRKGGFPVFLEKRPNGKNVTVIRNISGDIEALLKLLKRQVGAGGSIQEGAIELQGDHRDKVEAYLRANAAK